MYAWNSISRSGGPFIRPSLPRAIAKELKEKQHQDPGSPMPRPPNQLTGPPMMSEAPKGCYCQMGSIFRAILFLTIILGLSGGLFYWLYSTQLSQMQPTAAGGKNETKRDTSDEENSILQASNQFLETFRRSKAMLDMEVNFSQEENNNATTESSPADDEEPLYIDLKGNLHTLEDLKRNAPKKVTEKPFIIEAITTTTTTTTVEPAENITETTVAVQEYLKADSSESSESSESATTTSLPNVSNDYLLDALIDSEESEQELTTEAIRSAEEEETTTLPITRYGDLIENEDIFNFFSGSFMPTPPMKKRRNNSSKNSGVTVEANNLRPIGGEEDVAEGPEEPDDGLDETLGDGKDIFVIYATSPDLDQSNAVDLSSSSSVASTPSLPQPRTSLELSPSSYKTVIPAQSILTYRPEGFDDVSSSYAPHVTHLQFERHHDLHQVNHHQQQQQQQHQAPRYVTKTVSGFMDFVTTVGNTVMVFTPQASYPPATVQSTLIVTPTRVVPRQDDKPSIGIEGLFEGFQRPQDIRPSSVQIRNDQNYDYDEAPRVEDVPKATTPLDDFKVVQATRNPSTLTKVASTTLSSNFIFVDGQPDVGLVTATGGTLIANGITTVHTTRVFGTYLSGGNYAQIVQSTAKVFEEDVRATPASGFAGSVQHVTEKPGFGLEVAGHVTKPRSSPPHPDNLPLESLFEGQNNVDEEEEDAGTGIASRIQQRIASKKSTQQDFRARLKSRFDRFKSKTQNDDEEQSSSFGRGSVAQISLPSRAGFGRSSPGFSGTRSRQRSSSQETEAPEEVDTDDEAFQEDSIGSRGSRSRFRSRLRPVAAASNIRPVKIELKPESVEELLNSKENTRSSSTFGSRNRNRFRDRVSPSKRNTFPTTSQSSIHDFKLSRPKPNFLAAHNNNRDSDEVEPTGSGGISFKKFNRFSRPDIRQSLLEKILGKGKGKNTLTPEEAEEAKRKSVEEIEEAEEASLEIEQVTNDIDPLQTTLHVSTVLPSNKDKTSTYLEVATIRSPYSFAIEEGMSTRFITVTRTFTNTIKPTITPSSTKPLFQTETIPAPENILTASPGDYSSDSDTDLSSSIETLPAIFIDPSTVATPALKTITETFSSTELMLKTSILPIVVNGKTQLHTLTESYYLTKLIEAVKTIPPLEFIPTSAFTDFDNILDEAGSEKREQLLPGELEFSDQDDFSSLEGPQEVRVKPPPGFKDDLSLLGSKFNPEEDAEEIEQPQLNLQSSIGQLNVASINNPFANILGAQLQSTTATPTLPSFNPLAGFSQEQLQQLALLQYLQNPVLGLGFGLPQQSQVIITSTPVYKTETMYATSTIPLFLGAKKFFTTLTQAIGLTTITEYEQATQTIGAANGLFGGFNFNQPQLAAAAPGGGNPAPGLIVTSEAVVKDTMVPTTLVKEFKITFRNTPTTTTLTSTSMISTQITSYVTRTVRAQATVAPGLGVGGLNPLAALLG